MTALAAAAQFAAAALCFWAACPVMGAAFTVAGFCWLASDAHKLARR